VDSTKCGGPLERIREGGGGGGFGDSDLGTDASMSRVLEFRVVCRISWRPALVHGLHRRCQCAVCTPSSLCLPCPQALRATSKLSTTIFYIPLVTTVVHLFNCKQGGKWDTVNTWQCYQGPHLALCIIAVPIVVGFSVFAILGPCPVLIARAECVVCGLHGCQSEASSLPYLLLSLFPVPFCVGDVRTPTSRVDPDSRNSSRAYRYVFCCSVYQCLQWWAATSPGTRGHLAWQPRPMGEWVWS
jgi:hypothetical protein